MKALANIAIALSLIGAGCSAAREPSIVKGNGWSFAAPDEGWWFVHRGSSGPGTLVGSSRYNVGSRPMNVLVTQKCSAQEEQTSPNLGHATKWMGGRLGELRADLIEGNVVYVAQVRSGSCTWTMLCEGDSTRASFVQSTCDSMVRSLEFHK